MHICLRVGIDVVVRTFCRYRKRLKIYMEKDKEIKMRMHNKKIRVIGYGLGNTFAMYRQMIERMFEVIAWCDTNEEKRLDITPSISAEQLKELEDEYDKILIIPMAHDASCGISNDLVNNYRVSRDRIFFMEQILLGREYDKYRPETIYYGQYADDAIIMNIMMKKHLGIDIHRVKYLELGVYEPIRISNTYLFYKLGGEGVLVDANPAIENKVNIVRPRDKFINCGVSGSENYEHEMKFYVCNTFEALSTLNKEQIKTEHGVLDEQFDEITVKVKGINEILRYLKFCPDLVSIDIEGEDEKVLQKWDFDIHKPRIFVIETSSEIVMETMLRNGYELYTINTGNAFFYLKGTDE